MNPIESAIEAASSPVEFVSSDPSTGHENWRGMSAGATQVAAAVAAARRGFGAWAELPQAQRVARLASLAEQYRAAKPGLAESICRETGKPKWEALSEVDAMIAKVSISIEAFEQRCHEQIRPLPGVNGVIRYRPHGVLAVLGPFNMPGHLPNGHIVPALLAGNTIVFKPSEQTPLVGQKMAEIFAAAGLGPGIVNVIQGAAPTAVSLARHPDVNGVLFTGSVAAGRSLSAALANDPEKILALEMGGNNPIILHETADLDAAALLIAQSAFITAGQRCSCARRLIVCKDHIKSEGVLERLIRLLGKLRSGLWTDQPEPFSGTMISSKAADQLLAAQTSRISGGAIAMVQMRRSPRSTALISPGLIDVTPMKQRPDVELFGPLLQVIRVSDFNAAMAEANHTAFGLSAGLITDNAEYYRRFIGQIRAGVTSWNRPTTGASSHLPFGGIGSSGNHRPSAFFAADYCAYPVASLESPHAVFPKEMPQGMD